MAAKRKAAEEVWAKAAADEEKRKEKALEKAKRRADLGLGKKKRGGYAKNWHARRHAAIERGENIQEWMARNPKPEKPDREKDE